MYKYFYPQATAAPLIRSFSELKNGWHYGSGQGATEIATNSALAVDRLLQKYYAHNIEAFPDVDGGILVSGYFGNETLEAFCDPNGRIDLHHEDNDISINDIEDISLIGVEEYLESKSWFPKKLFVLSTSHTIALKNSDSKALYSMFHQETKGYRFSIKTVLNISANQSVAISGNIIFQSQEILQSTGAFEPTISRPAQNWNTQNQIQGMNAISIFSG